MTELVPRLEASSNTAVGGRPGCRGAGGRRGFDVAAATVRIEFSPSPIARAVPGSVILTVIGWDGCRNWDAADYVSRRCMYTCRRTCRVRVVHVNQGRGGAATGRPAEPDTLAAGPRPPPSGRARGARKNSTGEAPTGVWSCSNCKLLRGRSPLAKSPKIPGVTLRGTRRSH